MNHTRKTTTLQLAIVILMIVSIVMITATSSSSQLSLSQSSTNTNPTSAQESSLAPEKTIAQSQITKGSNQSPALAPPTTTAATCSASVCVNPGETAYLNVICFNPVLQAVGTCIMLSEPPGATFSSTTGNPAFGTMTWTNAGPPGTYQASFQAIFLSAPPGFTCSDSSIFTLTIFVNSPPVANAGPDQTVNSSDTVTLQGSGTDADNDPLTYSWTQTAGPSVSLSSTNAQNPTFIAPKLDRRSQGITLSFQLVVNDGRIDSKPDDVNIIVKPSSSNPGGGQDKCDPAKIAEITQKFQTAISNARLIGFNVAADNLDLFLKGTGGIVDNSGNIQPKVMDVTWLRSNDAVTDAEQFNQQRFETSLNNFARTLNDGETKSFSVTLPILTFTASRFTELYYASGTSKIQSSGTFELTRSGNTVTVTGTVGDHWFDQYVWAAGKSTYIPGSGVIPDSDALLLQQGLVTEFDRHH